MNTYREYSFLDFAFMYYNEKLFNDALPEVLITLVNKPGSKGYYHYGRFATRNQTETHEIDEISLNPDVMTMRTDEEILSTLVHEMCHLYQYRVKPGKRGYHDKVWAERMESIGLMPSDTGLPGGKKTGQSCTHYILPGGQFQTATAELLGKYGCVTIHGKKEFLPGYAANQPASATAPAPGPEGAEKKTSKQKFTCPTCKQNAWAKPTAKLVCGECLEPMTKS